MPAGQRSGRGDFQPAARRGNFQAGNQSGDWISRIKNHEGGAGFEHTQDGPNQRGVSVPVNGDDIAGHNPARAQRVGQLITAGIGFLILQSGNLMETTKLMVGIVVLSLLGVLSHWGLSGLERAVIRWRHI